jgi:hypothetical protein
MSLVGVVHAALIVSESNVNESSAYVDLQRSPRVDEEKGKREIWIAQRAPSLLVWIGYFESVVPLTDWRL